MLEFRVYKPESSWKRAVCVCVTSLTAYLGVFQVYEQDDLSEQMASLEGLMKQLNAITSSAF